MFSQELVVVLLLVCSLNLIRDEVEGAMWNLSAEDHLELERQLKVLNKPAVKTLTTDFGEIYDCIDFYKQPAFDHPLLKDYKVEFQWKPSLPHNESKDLSSIRLRQKQCPFGTVPIRRITKDDLIRERLALEVRPLLEDTQSGAHYAVRRTIGDGGRYDGAGADGNIIYTPPASGQQYSAGRVKVNSGSESLESGWRVDPTLYGDSLPHFYIRIDAAHARCFDTRCSAFIVVDRSISIGGAIASSTRGGSTKEAKVFLARNLDNGNWNVEVEDHRTLLGYWPKILLTGFSDGAASLEWGGEVFSPPGTKTPPMGAGYVPYGTSIGYDAFFRNPKRIIGKATLDIFDRLETFQDSNDYQVRGKTNFGRYFGHMIFYGGHT